MSEQPVDHFREQELLNLRRELAKANRLNEKLQDELAEQLSFMDALLETTPDFLC